MIQKVFYLLLFFFIFLSQFLFSVILVFTDSDHSYLQGYEASSGKRRRTATHNATIESHNEDGGRRDSDDDDGAFRPGQSKSKKAKRR